TLETFAEPEIVTPVPRHWPTRTLTNRTRAAPGPSARSVQVTSPVPPMGGNVQFQSGAPPIPEKVVFAGIAMWSCAPRDVPGPLLVMVSVYCRDPRVPTGLGLADAVTVR